MLNLAKKLGGDLIVPCHLSDEFYYEVEKLIPGFGAVTDVKAIHSAIGHVLIMRPADVRTARKVLRRVRLRRAWWNPFRRFRSNDSA